MTAPPADASPYGVFWPAHLPAPPSHVRHGDGREESVAPTPGVADAGERHPAGADPVASAGSVPPGARRLAPVGRVLGARSGDKGGDANLGLWARSDDAYAWLVAEFTPDRIRELLPEARDLEVSCHPLPHLRAVNVVLTGLLGEGVASSTRFDPQAKGLGEWFRSREVDVPVALLGDGA
jgi:hypothetical protein